MESVVGENTVRGKFEGKHSFTPFCASPNREEKKAWLSRGSQNIKVCSSTEAELDSNQYCLASGQVDLAIREDNSGTLSAY